MIDSLTKHSSRAVAEPLPFGLEDGSYALLTLHRPSNVDEPATLRGLFDAINAIAAYIPVLFPPHPRTAQRMNTIELHHRVRVIQPLGYIAFLGLMARARLVLTDSGGIQEETTVLKVPCLTLRHNTERPITCEQGTNFVVGTDPKEILQATLRVLSTPSPNILLPDKWDGHAGERIADALVAWLSRNRAAALTG
jgi:UDP-N-acetylglucosamine 2-epimerase (non-hydrolysing)